MNRRSWLAKVIGYVTGLFVKVPEKEAPLRWKNHMVQFSIVGKGELIAKWREELRAGKKKAFAPFMKPLWDPFPVESKAEESTMKRTDDHERCRI